MGDWRKLAQALHTRFPIGAFADGAAFAGAVAEAGLEPEVRVGSGFVDVRAESAEDAQRISAIAQSLGLTAEPSAVAQIEIGLDTDDRDAIGPFWAAVLTGDPGNYRNGDVVDPSGRVATVWFQGTEPHETPRQRFHLDLWVAPEVVAGRIEAALAVGGRVTYDDEAPAFTVLADPQGNKVCLCTYLGR